VNESNCCNNLTRKNDASLYAKFCPTQIRGPALKGVYIIGFAVTIDMRFGSSQRSGSNISASAPHKSGLRCISKGMNMIGVEPGIYRCSFGEGMLCLSGENDDESAEACEEGGRAHASGRDSRTLSGTGGKRRRVSLRTARMYLRLLRLSYVGMLCAPCVASTSSRNRLVTSGYIAMKYVTKVSRQAVVSRDAKRILRSSSRMRLTSSVL